MLEMILHIKQGQFIIITKKIQKVFMEQLQKNRLENYRKRGLILKYFLGLRIKKTKFF